MIPSTLLAVPDTVRGLPLHPLLVHAVVVLVPLVAIGTLVLAVWPRARARYGGLVVLGALGTTALVPFTTESGEAFSQRIGAAELVRDHSMWGERMLPVMVVLLLAVLALVVLDGMRRAAATDSEAPDGSGPGTGDGTPKGRTPAGDGAGGALLATRLARATPASLTTSAGAARLRVALVVVSVIAVVAALVALYVVFQTGESGTRAVWEGR